MNVEENIGKYVIILPENERKCYYELAEDETQFLK